MGEEVRDGMSRGIVDAENVLPSRVGDLLHGLGHLDLRLAFAVPLDGRQFVHCSEDGIALRGYEPLTHSEAVYAGTLIDDRCDGVLVEAVRCYDPTVLESRIIKHPADLLREVGKVPGVQTDPLQPLPHRSEDLLRHTDRIGCT